MIIFLKIMQMVIFQGRISGYTVEDMKQFFSFNETRAFVHQLDVYDDIVVAVTSNTVAGYKRTGHAFFRAQYD